MAIKDRLILRRIAKRWCQSILLANDMTDTEVEELLTEEEMQYIINECKKISLRIIDEQPLFSLIEIIKEEFNYNDDN